MSKVWIRFECAAEDRISQEYGPWEFVQLTYTMLRVGPDGEEFAYYDNTDDGWFIGQGTERWSDVVIYNKEAS